MALLLGGQGRQGRAGWAVQRAKACWTGTCVLYLNARKASCKNRTAHHPGRAPPHHSHLLRRGMQAGAPASRNTLRTCCHASSGDLAYAQGFAADWDVFFTQFQPAFARWPVMAATGEACCQERHPRAPSAVPHGSHTAVIATDRSGTNFPHTLHPLHLL